MKNFIIFIAVYITFITSAFAQNEIDSVKMQDSFFRFNTKEKVSYEIRAGVNFAFMSFDVPANVNIDFLGKRFTGKGVQPGYNIGLLVDMPFLENIYFQTGLFLTGKGVHANYEEAKPVYCLENPFLISYRKDISRQFKLDLNVGMYIESDWMNEAFLAYGLVGGVGLRHNKWYYGIRYDLGLTSKEVGYWAYGSQSHDKNNIFSIAVGYKL